MTESSNKPAGDNTAGDGSAFAEAITTTLRRASFLRVTLVLAATVVVLVGIHLGAPILNPIFFAIVLTLLFSPIYSWLLRRGLPAPLALVLMLFRRGGAPAMMNRLRTSVAKDNPQVERLTTVGQSVVRQFGLRAIVNLVTGAGVTVMLFL